MCWCTSARIVHCARAKDFNRGYSEPLESWSRGNKCGKGARHESSGLMANGDLICSSQILHCMLWPSGACLWVYNALLIYYNLYQLHNVYRLEPCTRMINGSFWLISLVASALAIIGVGTYVAVPFSC